MDEKKLHIPEFQPKVIGGSMRCKLLQKKSTGKTTEPSKHLRHIAVEKIFFSELNRSAYSIKLTIQAGGRGACHAVTFILLEGICVLSQCMVY